MITIICYYGSQTEGVEDRGGEVNVEDGTFNPVTIFYNVATVGLDSLRSVCPNIILGTPVAPASRERLQPHC